MTDHLAAIMIGVSMLLGIAAGALIAWSARNYPGSRHG